MTFVIITGMSGAGKSQASHCLEDLGFFCVDNLPTALIPTFAHLCTQSAQPIPRVALVIDARERGFLGTLSESLERLRQEGHRVHILFFDARDDILVRRFSETRRPHPLSPQGSVLAGIQRERDLLASLRAQADRLIDTSELTIHDLRRFLSEEFRETPDVSRPTLALVSFGYKFGLPPEADYVFDVRFLPNPHFEESLHALSGKDPVVQDFLRSFSETGQFLDAVMDFLAVILPLCRKEGRSYLTIAVGCTGGRHRSVALVEELAKRLQGVGHAVQCRHRDIDRS